MSDDRSRMLHAQASWLRSTFWDEVEAEVESFDGFDFVEFLQADSLSLPIRPEFRDELRGQLRDFVRTRYTT